jgi:hypothetical protein
LIIGGALWVGGFNQVMPVALNLLAVMAALYGMQGFAIIMYHLTRISMGRLPKILFWVIFFLTIVFSGFILVIIGVIDNWFDLRPVNYYKEEREKGNNDESNT